jgi:hypothetical protein
LRLRWPHRQAEQPDDHRVAVVAAIGVRHQSAETRRVGGCYLQQDGIFLVLTEDAAAIRALITLQSSLSCVGRLTASVYWPRLGVTMRQWLMRNVGV